MRREHAMKRTILAALLGVLVSGCAASPDSHTLVVLQHPTTKDIRECRADAWTTWNVYAEVEACAKAYEKAGYKRLGQY